MNAVCVLLCSGVKTACLCWFLLKKNGSKIQCYDVLILKCAEQTSSCTSKRALHVWEGRSGTAVNFCGVLGLAIVLAHNIGFLIGWISAYKLGLCLSTETTWNIREDTERIACGIHCKDTASDIMYLFLHVSDIFNLWYFTNLYSKNNQPNT